MKKFAWWISLLFGPMVLIPAIFVLLVINLVRPDHYFLASLMLFVCEVLLPSLIYIGFYKAGKISDMDITKRQERFAIYPLFLLCQFLGVAGAWYLAEMMLMGTLLTLWILAFLMVYITFFWKISVHAIVAMSTWMLLIKFYGFSKMWWFGIFVYLVMWSRLKLKRHTFGQVVAGGVMPVLMFGLKI